MDDLSLLVLLVATSILESERPRRRTSCGCALCCVSSEFFFCLYWARRKRRTSSRASSRSWVRTSILARVSASCAFSSSTKLPSGWSGQARGAMVELLAGALLLGLVCRLCVATLREIAVKDYQYDEWDCACLLFHSSTQSACLLQ